MLAFGFDELKLHHISSQSIADNFASARVLERVGMQLEGRLRENEWIMGRWRDTLLYAILDKDDAGSIAKEHRQSKRHCLAGLVKYPDSQSKTGQAGA